MANDIGYNVISYLKYLYGKNPTADANTKKALSAFADYVRKKYNINNYGADVPLNDNYRYDAVDQPTVMNLLTEWWNTPEGNANQQYFQTIGEWVNNDFNARNFQVNTQVQEPSVDEQLQAAYNDAYNQANQIAGINIDYQQNLISANDTYYNQSIGGIQSAQQAFDIGMGSLLSDAGRAAEDYGKYLESEINSQRAYYQSLLGSNWLDNIKSQLDKLQSQEIDTIDKLAQLAKEGQAKAYEAGRQQIEADYYGVIDEIKAAAEEARTKTTEEMNARGMFFSGVIMAALSKVDETEIKTIAKTKLEMAAKLAKLASDLAIATSNIDIETLKSKSSVVTKYGLEMLNLTIQDEQDKRMIRANLAALDAKLEGIPYQTALKRYELETPIKQQQFAGDLDYQQKISQLEAEQGLAKSQGEAEIEKLKAMQPIEAEEAGKEAKAQVAKQIEEEEEKEWKRQKEIWEMDMKEREYNLKAAQAKLDYNKFLHTLDMDKLHAQQIHADIDKTIAETGKINAEKWKTITASSGSNQNDSDYNPLGITLPNYTQQRKVMNDYMDSIVKMDNILSLIKFVSDQKGLYSQDVIDAVNKELGSEVMTAFSTEKDILDKLNKRYNDYKNTIGNIPPEDLLGAMAKSLTSNELQAAYTAIHIIKVKCGANDEDPEELKNFIPKNADVRYLLQHYDDITPYYKYSDAVTRFINMWINMLP